MFATKVKPVLSPQAVLDRMFVETLDKHRYERLEWDVSWTTVRLMQCRADFVALDYFPGKEGYAAPFPRDLEGYCRDMPVYLDRELQDGVIEIRDMHGVVLATTDFS